MQSRKRMEGRGGRIRRWLMEVLAEKTTLTKKKRAIEELDLGPRFVKALLPKING